MTESHGADLSTTAASLRAKRSNLIIDCFVAALLAMTNVVYPTPTLAQEKSRVQMYFEKGTDAYYNGQYNEAIQYYEKAAEIVPDFAPIYNALGLVHLKMNAKLADIMWFFKEAVAADPKYAPAYENMCKIHYQMSNYTEAEDMCRKALSSNPSLREAHATLAWVYLVGKDQPAQAIPYFDGALRKEKTPTLYFGLGMAHALRGNHPHVLDVVTILRGFGANEMAAELENTLRTDGKPQLFTQYIPMPQGQPSKLVSAAPTLAENPAPPSKPRPATGTASGLMRVRLRGKLQNIKTQAVSTIQAQQAQQAQQTQRFEQIQQLQQAERQQRAQQIQQLRQLEQAQREQRAQEIRQFRETLP